MYKWDVELKYGEGSCSSCCFRNVRKRCEDMPCRSKDPLFNVHWYVVHASEEGDVVWHLLPHFISLGGNPKELAEKKRMELFEFMKAGGTIDAWHEKKYDEARRGMGRK